ncbi:MAG: hypothetical protein JWM58_2305 [Rhizobium sp.]|nr:hypothetical protein [Rhizobium sp.]
MKLYRFLTGQDDSAFCHRVTDALNKGWQLQGSPTYAFNSDTKLMMAGQAIVKDVPGKDYSPDMKLSEQ